MADCYVPQDALAKRGAAWQAKRKNINKIALKPIDSATVASRKITAWTYHSTTYAKI
jgi:hypothetical protein